MKKIKLNLDYKLKFEEGKEPENIDKEYSELSRGYIDFAVSASNASGLSGHDRRVFGRIQNLIDKAIEDKSYVIELDDKDHFFLKNCFMSEKTKFNATLSRYVILLEDEILA
jgi:hypothetical protein